MKSTDITNIYMGDTQGQKLFLGDELIWPISGPTPPPTGYTGEYLTIEALESGNLYVRAGDIEYSINDGTWQRTTATIPLTSGDEVRFRGSSPQMTEYTSYLFSGNTLAFNVYGNIMSLQYYDNFSGQTQLLDNFGYLFAECTGLVDASNLILPATTLAQDCYEGMFQSCSSLTAAPVLPATTLARGCYGTMFAACSSLTTAPALPAATMAELCYGQMFYLCSSLTAAPALTATTLAERCYEAMFQGCTSLTTAPELPAMTLASSCYSGMFQNCTSLTAAPELPATTLTGNCYANMFNGCTNLRQLTCMAENNFSLATSNWLENTYSGTFYCPQNSFSYWSNNRNGSGVPPASAGWSIQVIQ